MEFIKYKEINKTILNSESKYLSVVPVKYLSELSWLFDNNVKRIESLFEDENCVFDSHEGYDLISIEVMDAKNPQESKEHFCIYLSSSLLLFIGENNNYLMSALDNIKDSQIDSIEIGDVLYYIIENIIADDFDCLEAMEDTLAEIEELVVTGKRSRCMREIMGYRRDLREMKKFYHQMYFVCSQILENENGIITREKLRYFKNLNAKLDRLISMVISLRDYVSQVLDEYQSQVEISQNTLMKVFTVVTSVFMPLTLITGWYGMNLNLPEFDWEYGYLYVIILSVVMVTGLIVYFKKKHWF